VVKKIKQRRPVDGVRPKFTIHSVVVICLKRRPTMYKLPRGHRIQMFIFNIRSTTRITKIIYIFRNKNKNHSVYIPIKDGARLSRFSLSPFIIGQRRLFGGFHLYKRLHAVTYFINIYIYNIIGLTIFRPCLSIKRNVPALFYYYYRRYFSLREREGEI